MIIICCYNYVIIYILSIYEMILILILISTLIFKLILIFIVKIYEWTWKKMFDLNEFNNSIFVYVIIIYWKSLQV